MKKLFVICSLISLFIIAAASPPDTKLIGVWKIQSMDIKGTKMLHQDMGQPYIEFNKEGGFMIKLSSYAEKGRYKLKGNMVSLKFLIPKRPAQKMVITHLDDKEMDYTTSDSSGVVHVTCFRITTGLRGDKD